MASHSIFHFDGDVSKAIMYIVRFVLTHSNGARLIISDLFTDSVRRGKLR